MNTVNGCVVSGTGPESSDVLPVLNSTFRPFCVQPPVHGLLASTAWAMCRAFTDLSRHVAAVLPTPPEMDACSEASHQPL